MTQTFSTLRAANVARQAEWDPSDKITLAFRGNEMGGECGEAQNVIKKLERERLGIRGSRATVLDLAEELADVVICADLIALAEGIDLDAAVARKFNLTSEKNGLQTRLSTPGAIDPDRETSLCDAAVAYRARVACDILEGFTDGIDGARLGELARWTTRGRALDQTALLRAFAAPWIAAQEEAGWQGDPQAEARKDLVRHTQAARALGASGVRINVWRTDIENAPRDGSLFLGCNADHPSFGAHAMQRRVRLAFGPDGQPATEDLGGWLILRGNQHDYDDRDEVPGTPQYAIAPDDLNTSVRYAWQPLPSTERTPASAYLNAKQTSALDRLQIDAEVMSDEVNDLAIRVIEDPDGDRARYSGDIGRDLRTLLKALTDAEGRDSTTAEPL